jgi:Flp pilus assembly protein TadD
MRAIWTTVFMALATPLLAAPSGGYSTSSPATGELTAATGLIESGRYAVAIATLERIIQQRPRNADALNLLGYAHRKSGDLQTSREYYTRALLVDPSHDGALAYMGELELQQGNFEAASALRTRLVSVCPTGCDALDELNAAFAAAGIDTTS